MGGEAMTAPVDPHTTATRRQVWSTISLAVMEARLPEPHHLAFITDAQGGVVNLLFDSHDAAGRWAEWVSPETAISGKRIGDDIDYYGHRLGWRWVILGTPLTAPPIDMRALAAAILTPDAEVTSGTTGGGP